MGFSTSPVVEIVSKNCFKTRNSVYEITEVCKTTEK